MSAEMEDVLDVPYVPYVVQLIQDLNLMELFRPREEDQEWLRAECGLDAEPTFSDQELTFRFLDWMLEQNRVEELIQLESTGCPMFPLVYDYLGYAREMVELYGEREMIEQDLLQFGICNQDPRLLLANYVAKHMIHQEEEVIEIDYAIQSFQEAIIHDGYPYCFVIDSLIATPIEWECTGISHSVRPALVMKMDRHSAYYLQNGEPPLAPQVIRSLMQRYQEAWSVWFE